MTFKFRFLQLIALFLTVSLLHAQEDYLKDWGIQIGIFEKGNYNSITDVSGVRVGHVTIHRSKHIRTGVTAILPHSGNLFKNKVPGAIHVGNGFGKLAGMSQVDELGTIEAPIILTNTLSVSKGIEGGIKYSLEQEGNDDVRSVNIVVGETNDGRLNDIRGLHVSTEDVLHAISSAESPNVAQGNVGAGTGTISFGFKGGIGTSSRVLPKVLGGYSVGVLVQANFGGVLEIAGVPVSKELNRFPFQRQILNPDGSCMIVVCTDAPILDRNLKRMAKRAMLGFGKTGGMSSNGSGDYVIAFSTNEDVRFSEDDTEPTYNTNLLKNKEMSALFQATIEATEEAIINALLHAKDMEGYMGRSVNRLDHDKLKSIFKKYGRIN